MMKYLQRQRKSVVLSTGFKRVCCLILAVVVLLSVVITARVCRSASGVTEDFIGIYEGTKQVTMSQAMSERVAAGIHTGVYAKLSAPMDREAEEQYNTRNLLELRGRAEIGECVAFRYRYLQQIRLFVWYMITGFLLLAGLFYQYYGSGRIRQRELVPRSRMIVSYIRRADGKKNGIASFIK